ncbi:MAG TPA: protein kinase [Polyangiaceae bacterium]|jgi:tetratricopeptide (TPR) repeat protein
MPDTQVIIEGLVGGAIVITVLAKLFGGSSAPKEPPGPKPRGKNAKVTKAIARGDFERAALLAAQDDDLETAYELYVRAQQPVKAAQLALRLGKSALAGELFEKAGDRMRAATAYRQAGMISKADELDPPRLRLAPSPAAAAEGPAKESHRSKIESPAERAEHMEAQWRTAKNAVPEDAAAQARVTELAEAAIEAWLSAGEIKRGADLARDAGFVDQAVNMYVNVLGDPGSAAQVLAGRGEHKRAAELYELAGQKERSLQAWVDWSHEALDPLEHLADVKRLGEEATSHLLKDIVASRPLVRSTLDLHYRVALAMEDDPRAAKAVLEQVAIMDPGYRDVNERIVTLERIITKLSPQGQAPPARPAPPPVASVRLSPSPAPPPPPPIDSQGESAGVLPARRPIERIAQDVAARAADILARGAQGARAASRSSAPPRGHAGPEVALTFTGDPLVKDARRGPTVAELKKLIGGRPPDLGNIEVYYRLGLAYLARGQYQEAREAFEAVEEVSPGYRDAAERASQLMSWKKEVAPSLVGGAGAGAGAVAKRYTLLGELGRGGMAVVCRARDEALGREVALKFLSEEAVGNKVFMDFFQREARAAGSLNHPNIVTIYDVGELDGRAFICMELIDGVSIDSLLDRDERLPLAEALRITEQVLVALDYAHKKKIIHRDIKPANIMRGASGLVKLMDFGLAKSLEGGAKSTVISGTPSYMAPEQLTGKGVDPRTDLFAVGATLYEMITGDVPFHGMVRVEPPKSVREAFPVVPDLLDELILRSLEFNKERRFPTAEDMLLQLREILAAVPAAAREGEARPSAGTAAAVRLRSPTRASAVPREEPASSGDAAPSREAKQTVDLGRKR